MYKVMVYYQTASGLSKGYPRMVADREATIAYLNKLTGRGFNSAKAEVTDPQGKCAVATRNGGPWSWNTPAAPKGKKSPKVKPADQALEPQKPDDDPPCPEEPPGM